MRILLTAWLTLALATVQHVSGNGCSTVGVARRESSEGILRGAAISTGPGSGCKIQRLMVRGAVVAEGTKMYDLTPLPCLSAAAAAARLFYLHSWNSAVRV